MTGFGAVARHHPVRVVLAATTSLVVAAVLAVLAAYLLRDTPGAESIGSATRRFASVSTTAPAHGPLALPAAGVYTASGEGTEHISRPPDSARDSSAMPVTVTYLAGGCWQWHIDYNTADWHSYDFCPHGDRLLLTAQRNEQSWDLGLLTITNVASFTCEPPTPVTLTSPRVGQRFPMRCVGTNTAVRGTSVDSGTVTVDDVATLLVGGRPVRAVHMVRRQQISGSQTGQLNESWWFDASTGLPLAESRQYRLVTASPIGTITYTEAGSWRLDSLVPRT